MITMASQFLRVVFSPGVQPDKWFGRFDERVPWWRVAGAQADDPLKYIRAAAADVALVRVGAAGVDKNTFHIVDLYDEQVGVAAPKEHPIKVMDRRKLCSYLSWHVRHSVLPGNPSRATQAGYYRFLCPQ